MSTTRTVMPASEETLKTYDLMHADQARDSVFACHAAFEHWRTTTHSDRAGVLRKIAPRLRDRADELAELMTDETGKLLRDGRLEVELCAQIFEYTAEHGPAQLADEERTHEGGEKRGIVSNQPIGVIYSVQPWNFPLY